MIWSQTFFYKYCHDSKIFFYHKNEQFSIENGSIAEFIIYICTIEVKPFNMSPIKNKTASLMLQCITN